MAGQQREPSLTIKLLIERERNRVVLAEAGKDFVDILFSFLSLPIGTIVRLVREPSNTPVTLGCFNNLYRSVEHIGKECFKTEACKRMLLYPKNVEESKCRKLKFNLDDTVPTKYFMCPDSCMQGSKVLLSYDETARCHCGKLMNQEAYCMQQAGTMQQDEGGSKFFVTDDFCLSKNTAGFLIKYLDGLGVKSIGQLDEKVITIGFEQVSCLLRNFLTSDCPLTDTLLRKQRAAGSTVFGKSMISRVVKFQEPGLVASARVAVDMIVRKSDGKVLCVEADKKFIDLLFTFLTLPLRTALQNLQRDCSRTHACILNLLLSKKEIMNRESTVEVEAADLPPYYSCHRLLSNIKAQSAPRLVCSRVKRLSGSAFHVRHVVESRGAYGGSLPEGVEPVWLIDPKSASRYSEDTEGYVGKKSLFLVSDDLVVRPLVSTSTISFVKELGVPICDIERKTIRIGEQEALKLLDASLHTSSALTSGLGSLLKV